MTSTTIMLFERYSNTMTAYHGSRYDFDDFSLSMFGEGVKIKMMQKVMLKN